MLYGKKTDNSWGKKLNRDNYINNKNSNYIYELINHCNKTWEVF